MVDKDDVVEIDEGKPADEDSPVDEGDKPAQSAAEIEARRHGWVPEAEWDDSRQGSRKPAKFISAEEFLERVTGQLPILRERLRANDKVIEELHGKIDEMHKLFKYQAANQKKARETEYLKSIADAKKRMKQSVADADPDEYSAAEAEKERLEAEARDAAATETEAVSNGKDAAADAPSKIDPETGAWISENKWFSNDAALNGYMIEMHQAVISEMPYLGSGRASLDEAKKRVMDKFPEKFGINKRRLAPATVATPSGDRRGAGSVIEARFAKIPAEDRAAYDRHRQMFKDMGQEYTKADFLNEYGM